MDIGSSTGGFTDCVLQRGASKVYAIDVGYGQLDWTLRHNPKVVLLENTNIRYLGKDAIPDVADLIVIDVSFISLKKVLPTAFGFLTDSGVILALIKPQFEVGRELVGKGGIVKDEEARQAAVEEVRNFSEELGLRAEGVFESPVRGQKGNIEYFMLLRRSE
jgi:23S rRNA (cytidine1920-2'-O)/16S rRNA (cytidine1409-2'-O)-methyltransferase